ncbi:MAG: S-layer homology domain-containing protein, partial [Bacillota bacterium]|nr:S-layer homology domain-containing protein [Bacillota bacterium]
MKKTLKNRLLSVIICVALFVCLIPAGIFATDTYSDTNGHWAEASIERWSNLGVIQGNNGKFMPNDNMRRCDAAIVLSKLFGYQKTSDEKFKDVAATAYYADAVSKARFAGSMNGTGENKFSPTASITRQEVATLICNLLNLQPSETCVYTFKDDAKIAAWAKGNVYAAANAGYMVGYDNRVNPTANITRAEFVTVFDKIFKEVVVGTELAKDIDGGVLVTKSGSVLKNMTIKGDLVIAEGVGDGDVTLDGVKVLGNTIVRGGGENSIHIKGDSNIGNVVLAQKGNGIRLEVTGNAVVGAVQVSAAGGAVKIEGKVET